MYITYHTLHHYIIHTSTLLPDLSDYLATCCYLGLPACLPVSRYRLDSPSKFLTALKLETFEDMVAQVLMDKASVLNNLADEAVALTEHKHRGGDDYWAAESDSDMPVSEVIKLAETRGILQIDAGDLKSMAAKLSKEQPTCCLFCCVACTFVGY